MKEKSLFSQEKPVGKEYIEDGIWKPGSFESVSEKVGIGGTTKKFKEFAGRPNARLRITGLRDRFASGFGEQSSQMRVDKLGAGRLLIKLLAKIDPEARARNIQKTALVHGDDISVVDKDYLEMSLDDRAHILADGLITNLPHVPLVVSAADCAPVAVFDKKNGAIGAFHAGWRGTLKDIATKGLDKMHEQYGTNPEDVLVVVGPRADKDRYVVDEGVRAQFLQAKDEKGQLKYSEEVIHKIFKAKEGAPGQYFFDFGLLVKLGLEKSGVPPTQIEMSEFSTMRDQEYFTSERVEGNKARDTDLMIISLKK